MAEPIPKQADEDDKTAPFMSRKEKRKAMKKEKRKQARKEMAVKEREEEEKRLNDPEEQRRLRLMEEEEAERRERELKEFEERERALIEAMERKRKEEEEKEEEEERRKLVEEANKQQDEKENECDDGDDWEYVEEGPAEIIWQGNEIIVRKKKVRVPKKGVDQLNRKEDVDRPTSNPLPPQSEAFADYQNGSLVSAQQVLENVAQQVPNFGTEQDKAHCPFHLKTGACRFGQRCSRVHFYPDKSCTLLIKNMYNGPGLAWEQDEGLEVCKCCLHVILCTDEEVERCYEEFYEDVHTEFLKFGEILNFKVCKNGSFHLRGNVYVHYKSLESAVLAYQSINGRYFAGKQVTCEFINVTRWKVAICGEFMKSRLMACSHGSACNFIHCFRNPGGDYEWADWDKPPPKYWVRKMAALFGYSDESRHEKQMEEEHFGQSRYSSKMITAYTDRDHSRRSRSREMDHLKTGSVRSRDKENDVRESTRWGRHTKDDRKRVKIADKKSGEENKDYHQSKSRSHEISSDEGWSDGDRDRHRDRYSKPRRKVSEYSTDYGDNRNRTHEADSDEDWSDRDSDRGAHHGPTNKGSRYHSEGGLLGDDGVSKKKAHKVDGDQLDRDGNRKANYGRIGESSRHQSRVKYADNHGDQTNTDSIEERLDGDRDGDTDRHRSHRRKSSGHHYEVSEFPGDHGNSEYGVCDTDSGGDWADRDKERRRSHRRKRSRHHNELSESSDDQGEPRKKSKENFQSQESDREKSNLERDRTHRHSLRRSCSSKEIGKADSSGNSLRSNGDHESSGSGQYDERSGSRYNSDENIDKQDRWEPESPKEDRKYRSKISSVDRYESGTPERYYGRNKSEDLSSENYYHEKIDEGGHWESQEDASEIKRKSGSKSSFDGKNSDGSRSRVNSRSSRERHSKRMEKETDSSVEYQEYEEKYKKRRGKHTSDGHKRHDKKNNS